MSASTLHRREPMERSTRQRAAIRGAIEAAGRPLSPQEVLEAAQREVPALGMATVYRNLKLLLEDGSVQMVELPGDSARYEAAGHGHHHHFRCEACHRVFDIHDCPGDLAKLVPKGFSVRHHDITLYGLCSDCQPARAGRRRASGIAR
jgi:Fur family ferric uptake transcriptional regulator